MQENKSFYYNELAIAALTLSMISFVQLLGLEKSITAIVFGILALKSIRQDDSQKGKNFALIGIVLGLIYTVFALVMLPHAIELLKKLAKNI